jgi:predicted nucleotidyltransferase
MAMKSNVKIEQPPSDLREIQHRLRTSLPELRNQYHISSLGLFGSYVRGEQQRQSDLDILVDFEITPTLLQLAMLQQKLSAITGVKVDLALRRNLKPAIGPYILAEVIYL